MTEKVKAVIYCRVSSREQEETGYSLPAQEKLLREYAERKGLNVVKVFSVAESASGAKQRIVFAEMMSYMEKSNVHHLLCEKVDRLTRNLKEAVIANDWIEESPERQIHFVKQNLVIHLHAKSDEKFRWDIEIVLAKKFISNLSEEVKKGQKEKIAQGWIPRRACVGYKTVGEKGHKIHVVDETTAPYVRKMFELYATGNYSLKVIGEIMYKDGFRSYTGKKASKSRIEDILKDPFFYGAIPWNGESFPGKHEPLVSKELFDKVQALRAGKTAPKLRKHNFQFKKLMKCGECSGTITAEIQKGHIYYHCNHYRNCQQKKFTTEDKIEEKILGVFKFFENITEEEAEEVRLKIKLTHGHESEYKEKAIKALEERYNALQKRIDNLYDDKLDEKISREFWERKNAQLVDEQREVLAQMDRMKTEEGKYFELWLNIIDLARRAREIYANSKTPEKKRLLLTKLFSLISLKDGEATYSLKATVDKVAQRVQQKLDAENFEPKQKTAKVVKTSGKLLSSTIEAPLEPSEARNDFRTSKKLSVKPRPGAFDSSSRPLLRTVEVVRTWIMDNYSSFYVPNLISTQY